MDSLEATVDRLEDAEDTQHFHLIEAQTECCTIDTQQIADVETTNERHKYFLIVNTQKHPVEAFLEDLAAMIGHTLYGIGEDLRARVLRHDETVLVIGVGDGKGGLL